MGIAFGFTLSFVHVLLKIFKGLLYATGSLTLTYSHPIFASTMIFSLVYGIIGPTHSSSLSRTRTRHRVVVA